LDDWLYKDKEQRYTFQLAAGAGSQYDHAFIAIQYQTAVN